MDLAKLWTLIICSCLTHLAIGQDSIQKKFGANGRLMEWPWKNGKINGIQKAYYIDGKLHSETVYVDGLPNGYSKEYYASGQLNKVRHFINNKANGADSLFTITGLLKSIQYFKEGNAYKVLVFDTSGHIIQEINVEKGIWKIINKKYRDNVLLEEDYVIDKIIKWCKIYDDSGKIIKLLDTTIFTTNNIKRIQRSSEGSKYKFKNWTEMFEFSDDSNHHVSTIWIEKETPSIRQLLYKNNVKVKELHQTDGKLDWCKFYIDGKEEKVIEYDKDGNPRK